MKEQFTPKESLVGTKKDAEGNIDTSRAAVMRVNAEKATEVEKNKNIETIRNLSEVFGKMSIGSDEKHISLMFQEQGPLITKYLKDKTKGGEGGEIYNQMAPGIAMLGFEMARSGFGREEIDSGDEILNKKLETTSKKRYQAAENVFNQLMNKMYPEGTSSGEVLTAQLDAPLGKANVPVFAEIKSGLERLYDSGLPNDDKEILEYQSQIDSLIQLVGDTLGESASRNAELGVEGTITTEEQERYQTDMLTMAMALKELHNLRRESVRHKHMSRSYDTFSPTDLKRIEGLEKKIKNMNDPETDNMPPTSNEDANDTMDYSNEMTGDEPQDPEEQKSPEFQQYVKVIMKNLDNLNEILAPKNFRPGSSQLITQLNYNIMKITDFKRVLSQVSPMEYNAIAQKASQIENKLQQALNICKAEQKKRKQDMGGEYVYKDVFKWLEKEGPAVMRSLKALRNKIQA